MVVGAGGTGSIFMSHLCRIWQAWTKLGGAPFAIHLYDDDTVSEANLARQCFCIADIGQPKAVVLAQRLRAFFGVPVEPHVEKIKPEFRHGHHAHGESLLFVGCVDNLAARRALAMKSRQTHLDKPKRTDMPAHYWLDMGNTNDSGQVVLGGHGLPDFFDLYPDQLKAKDPKDIPSCSMAESLSRQDLFINSTVATLAGQLLWQLMRHGGVNHHGYVINLSAGLVLPIKV